MNPQERYSLLILTRSVSLHCFIRVIGAPRGKRGIYLLARSPIDNGFLAGGDAHLLPGSFVAHLRLLLPLNHAARL
jgi:hypothetical protein